MRKKPSCPSQVHGPTIGFTPNKQLRLKRYAARFPDGHLVYVNQTRDGWRWRNPSYGAMFATDLSVAKSDIHAQGARGWKQR